MSLESYRGFGVIDRLKQQHLFFSITIDPGMRFSANDAEAIWARYPGQAFLLSERLMGEKEDLATFLTSLGYAPREVTQGLANAVSFDNHSTRPDFAKEREDQQRQEGRQWLYYGQINGKTVRDLLPLPPRRAQTLSVEERLEQLPPEEYLVVSNYNREKGTGISGPRPFPTGGRLHALYPGDAGIESLAFPFASNNLPGYLDAISTIPDARVEHSQEISAFITMFDKVEKVPRKKRS